MEDTVFGGLQREALGGGDAGPGPGVGGAGLAWAAGQTPGVTAD